MRDNPAAFFNDWLWVYAPHNAGTDLPTIVPFDLWPKQKEFLEWLIERHELADNALVEKSRDAGVSYMVLGLFLHRWLFVPGYAAAVGSRKWELVDKKDDPKSLFYKVRQMLKSLPGWMLPEGFKWIDHAKSGALINPANGATITGEAGDNMGRGGRATDYLIDEHAAIKHAGSVDEAVAGNARAVIYASTPKGMGNLFAQKRHGGTTPVFTFHWTDDPRKDDAWKKATLEKYGPVVFAQEFDVDYSASVEGIIIPAKWVRAAINLKIEPPADTAKADAAESKKPGRAGREARRRAKKATSWTLATAGLDVAGEGNAENVFAARRGPAVFLLEAWKGLTTTESAHRACDLCLTNGIQSLRFDSIGVGAGLSGTLRARRRDAKEKDEKGNRDALGFRFTGVNVGKPPSVTRYSDAPELAASERFANLKAELWWALRLRFYRTWEHVEGKATHPPDSLISIPLDTELIAQLSRVLHHHTETGKVAVESKKALASRGIKSPDRAEALVLCFADAAVGSAMVGRA